MWTAYSLDEITQTAQDQSCSWLTQADALRAAEYFMNHYTFAASEREVKNIFVGEIRNLATSERRQPTRDASTKSARGLQRSNTFRRRVSRRRDSDE